MKEKQKIYYQRTRIALYAPYPIRVGRCRACKRTVESGEIKTTQMHHTKYAYETATVLANPMLALENTLELGYCCHPIADGLRDLLLSNPRGGLRNPDRIIEVVKLLPPEQQRLFTELAKEWLWRQKNGET